MNRETELAFTIEFNAEGLGQDMETALFDEADGRLRELARGHNDLTGAAINIRVPAHEETPPLYQVTVVVYARPKQVAATEKRDTPTGALKGALSAVERQIREKRAKLGRRWERPDNDPVSVEVEELTAIEEEGIDVKGNGEV
jgi:ribosome-associated translation inhibitor RaiA